MTTLSRKSLGPVWIALALMAALASSWQWRNRGVTSSAAPLIPADAATSARMNEAYGKLPLSFERNQGQADPAVQFLSHGGGQSLRLEAARVALTLRGKTQTSTVSLKFLHANPSPQIEGEEELPGKSNYLTGADRCAWRTNIPTYAKVRYREVWPGVDAIFYGNPQQLEYDFRIAPGASPRAVKLAFEGVQKPRVDAGGDLILQFAGQELRQRKPVVYQEVNGEKRVITGRYVMKGDRIGFEIGRYDRRRELVIDPVLNYLARTIAGERIAVDVQGAAYITALSDFSGPGKGDALIIKLNATGTQQIFRTVIGGGELDRPRDIAVDAAGNVYVTGMTASTDFPGAPQGASSGVCYKTTNNALNWSYSGKGLPAVGMNALVMDPNNPRALYAGGDLNYVAIHKTTDGGTTWKPTNLTGRPLGVLPGNSNVLFSSIGDGLRKSPDGGITWAPSGLLGEDVISLVIDRNNVMNFYAATPARVYKSVDGGANWAAATTGLPAPFEIRQFAGNASTFYVMGVNQAGSVHLYKTQNGAANWEDVTPPRITNALAVDPVSPAVVYAGSDRGIFKSRDGGKNWQASGLSDYAIGLIAINPANPATLYASTLSRVISTSSGERVESSQGFFTSPNGGATWGDAYDGLMKGAPVYALAIDPMNPATIYAASAGSSDAFILKLKPSGDELLYVALLGGAGTDSGESLVVDQAGNTYVTGTFGFSSPSSLKSGFQTDGGPGFMAKLTPQGNQLAYFTRLPVEGGAIAADQLGKSSVAGRLPAGTAPLAVKNGVQSTPSKGDDAVVIALDPEKSGEESLLYSTYLAGIGNDLVLAIAVDAGGRIYVTGTTDSPDFPVTPNALRSQPGGAFLTKLDPAQSGTASLLWSSFLPTAQVKGIALDQTGHIYIAGAASLGYTTTPGALQTSLAEGSCPPVPTCGCELVMGFCPARCLVFPRPVCTDAFVSKITGDGRTLVYSTYLGAASVYLAEGANDLAVDAAGNVYLAGVTSLPATTGALQSSDLGFIAKLTLDARGTAVASVSAASFAGPQLAAESLAVGFLDAFGVGSDQLKVTIRDSAGVERDAAVLFSGSGQINFQIPPGTATGDAQVKVTSNGVAIATGALQIAKVAPGVFAANANGRGVAAAVALRVKPDNSQVYELIARYDSSLKQFVPVPIDLGPEGDQIILSLFGTGWRFRSSESAVRVTIGGPSGSVDGPVTYAGLQPTLTGLDQINVRLPRTLIGRGEVDVVVTVDGKTANTVKASIK